MKILSVDTDSEITENAQMALNIKKINWMLSILNSEEQCLNLIGSCNCPDVVIMGMSVHTSFNLGLLSDIRSYSDVPVIVISDDKNGETLVNTFDTGANDFITRPFNKNIFIARLEALSRRMQWDIHTRAGKSANRS
jgi:two-component system KDP operon response regulator KdpE